MKFLKFLKFLLQALLANENFVGTIVCTAFIAVVFGVIHLMKQYPVVTLSTLAGFVVITIIYICTKFILDVWRRFNKAEEILAEFKRKYEQ